MSQIVAAIEQHFGKMTVVRGQEHTFLGMEIVFNDNGTIKIRMKSYIEDAIKCFGEIVTKKVTMPAQKNILNWIPSLLSWTMRDLIFFTPLSQSYCMCPREVDLTYNLPWLSCAPGCQ